MSAGWPRGRAVAAVFLAAAAVYLVSPVRELSDSRYSLLAAQRLATAGTLDLAPAFAGELPLDAYPGSRQDGLPYQVQRVGERVLYVFPLGAVFVATPWMAVADALGAGVVDAGGRYLRDRELQHQTVLAALLAALFVAGAFAAAERALPRRWALAFAAALALATPVWSTASRGLWSHTVCLAALGLALPRLVRDEPETRAGAFGLGLLSAFAYVARPTAALAAALVAFELVRRAARAGRGTAVALAFAAGAVALAVPFVALSFAGWGTALPPYYRHTGLGPPRLEALAGVLVSPNRGLLVFEPALVLALAYGLLRARRTALGPLFGLGCAGLLLHTAVISTFGHWWGGHSYGPRLFTEAVFFEALIGLAVATALVARGERDRRWRRALAVALVGGFAIHAGGALSRQGFLWNSRPVEVDLRPERVWDWRDWQPLAWWHREPRRPGFVPSPELLPATALDAADRKEENRRKRRHAAREARRERQRAEKPDEPPTAPD